MVHCLAPTPSCTFPRCIADPVLPCGAQVAEELAYVRESGLHDLDGTSLLARVMERARLRAEERSSEHGGMVSRDAVILKATHMSGGSVLVEASSKLDRGVGASENVSTLVRLRCLKAPCCVRSIQDRTWCTAAPCTSPRPGALPGPCTVSEPCVPQVRSSMANHPLNASVAEKKGARKVMCKGGAHTPLSILHDRPAPLRTVAAAVQDMCAYWVTTSRTHLPKGCLFEQRLNVSRVARVFAWHARPHIVHSHAVHLP